VRRASLLVLATISCEPLPERLQFQGPDTLYPMDREEVFDGLRDVLKGRYVLVEEDPAEGTILTEWLPQFDEWEKLHFRQRARARLLGRQAPFQVDIQVERAHRDPFSGRWIPQGSDSEEEQILRRDVFRRLGR
jgi:hypothetical protein